MEKFTYLSGVAAPLFRKNIDTDAILPSRFLTKINETGKSGFGKFLFADWRFKKNNDLNQDFILNKTSYNKSKILLTDENFGCGSSREHAVWALLGFGIRAVIAPSFGEIFYNNCFKNGLFPLIMNSNVIERIIENLDKGTNKYIISIDLNKKKITDNINSTYTFEIDDQRRLILLEGKDPISITLEKKDLINNWQKVDKIKRPWIYLEKN